MALLQPLSVACPEQPAWPPRALMLSGIESQRAAVLLTADETFKERLGTDEHDVFAHSREPVERQNARSEDRCTTLADDDGDSSGSAQQHDGTALGDETCLCASVCEVFIRK